jgi:hypothetical protein
LFAFVSAAFLESWVNIMSKPVVVTISHELGRQQAKDRVIRSIGQIRAQLAPHVSSMEDSWTDDRLDFRLTAVGQTVAGHIEVLETFVRIEVVLPGMLGFLGRVIGNQISQQGTILLEKPKA